MRRIAAWQITFLAGIVLLLILVFAVLGSGTLTAVVALAVVIVTILHALMTQGSSSAPIDSKAWLAQLVRRALQVSKLLIVSTLAIWIAIISLSGYGAWKYWKALNTVTLRGIVLSASGAPVNGAVVTLQQDDRDMTSKLTQSGSFEFPNITLRRSNNVVRVSWRGKIVTVSVNKGNSEALRITLPVVEARMRVLYFEIYGHAIDLLVRGELRGGWETALGGQPTILKNDTFAYLTELVKRFTAPLSVEFFSNGENAPEAAEQELRALLAKHQGKPFFVGSWTPGLLFDDVAETVDFQGLLDGARPWRADQDDSLQNTFFWRYAQPQDLGGFDNEPWIQYYRFITHATFPRDFAPIAIYPNSCAGSWRRRMLFREARLRVVVLENISDQPLRFSDFTFRKVPRTDLRPEADDNRESSTAPQSSEAGFPEPIMRGEKLLIPLQIVLKFGEDKELPFQNMSSLAERGTWANQLESAKSYRLRTFYVGEQPVVIPGALLKKYGLEPRELAFDRSYVTGPSSVLESVAVDGTMEHIRQASGRSIFLRSGMEGGSCPILYTRDGGSWRREGPILYGLKALALKGLTKRLLRRFDGTILIREEEPEVSYIDALWIREIATNGAVAILRPADQRLRATDGTTITLHPGDKLTVSFPEFRPAEGRVYELYSEGYYESIGVSPRVPMPRLFQPNAVLP